MAGALRALLADRGRYAERQIACDEPPTLGDPERLLRHILDFPNAVWRFQKQRSTWSRCLLISFRTTAVSDEKRENILWIGFNTGSGAALGDVQRRLRAFLGGDQTWQMPRAGRSERLRDQAGDACYAGVPGLTGG